MAVKTAEQIIDFFSNNLVDGENFSDDLAVLNEILNELYGERRWYFLKTYDDTKTKSLGVEEIDMPTDLSDIEELFIGSNRVPYTRIPMEKRVELRDVEGYFWLDFVNRKIKFTGSPTDTGTVYLNYWYLPAELEATDSPVFDQKFHLYPAYRMAERFFPSDGGERSRSWHDYYGEQADNIKSDMETMYNEMEEKDKMYEQ